jgi:hypothetical protein
MAMSAPAFTLDVRRQLLGQRLADTTGRTAGYLADLELDALDGSDVLPAVTALLAEPLGQVPLRSEPTVATDRLVDVLTGSPARIDLDLVASLRPPIRLHVPAAELCPMPLGERVRDRLVLRVPLVRDLIGAVLVDDRERQLGSTVDVRLVCEWRHRAGGPRVRMAALVVVPGPDAQQPGDPPGPVLLPWREAVPIEAGRIGVDPAALVQLRG